MQLKCTDWRRFWRKKRFPKCPNSQVMTIFARSPKTRIFWKSTKGGPRDIFQKSPKTLTSIKRPKTFVAQMAISSHSCPIKVRGLKKILAQKAAPKVPERPNYGNFGKLTQSRIFWKSAKGGPSQIFKKSHKKLTSIKRPKSSLAKMALSSN